MLGLFKKKTVAPLVSNVESTLREGSDLLSNDAIVLNEKLTGNLFCAGEVLVAADGLLLGNITSKICTVSGVVKGNIGATDTVDLKSTAVVEGNVQAPVLNIEEGAVINGTIAVTEDIALTRTRLLKKINSYTTDQYLSAKISTVLTDVVNGVPQEKPLVAVTTQMAKVESNNTMAAAEKNGTAILEPQVTEKPQVVQKELSAASPQPKATENTEPNNRWW